MNFASTVLPDLLTPRLAFVLTDLAVQITGIIVATIILVLGIVLVSKGRRRLLAWIAVVAVERTRRIASAHLRGLSLRQALLLARLLVRLLALTLIAAGVFTWVTVVLHLVPSTHDWAGHLEESAIEQIGVLMQAAISTLPGLCVVAVIYIVTRTLNEGVNNYFLPIESGEIKSEQFDQVTAEITRRMSTLGLWLCAVIVAYPYVPGSESPIFKGITVLAGLMLSLGSSNLVGHIMTGLVMIYNRTIRPGDFIVTPDLEGTIDQVGMFSCSIRTTDGVVVTVPNSRLFEQVRNYSRANPESAVRNLATVTIGYDAPWQQVHALLVTAARDVAEIKTDPAPYVRQAALEDFYVRYELVYAPVVPNHRKKILSDLNQAIQDRFHAAGVQIMSPHYRSDPAVAKIPPAKS